MEFNTATAIQYLGSSNGNAGQTCNDTDGKPQPCTQDCEILGEGPPVITTLDPNDPYGGVQVTYFGVPSVGNMEVRMGICWAARAAGAVNVQRWGCSRSGPRSVVGCAACGESWHVVAATGVGVTPTVLARGQRVAGW